LAVAAASIREDGTADHETLLRFVEDHMMPAVQRALGWRAAAHTKFRASDLTNAVDASCFHRDVIACEPDRRDAIYTALVYLDDADMEVVEGSHERPAMGWMEALRCVATPLHLEAGEMLIFHSLLLHRGLFAGRAGRRRRLLQVFDVMDPTAPHPPTLLHVPGRADRGKFFLAAALEWPVLLAVMNWFGYMNAAIGYNATGTQGRYEASYLSNEGHAGRGDAVVSKANVYVCRSGLRDMAEGERRAVPWRHYQRQFVAFALALLVALLLTAWAARPVLACVHRAFLGDA
jgi:hypothetical protein